MKRVGCLGTLVMLCLIPKLKAQVQTPAGPGDSISIPVVAELGSGELAYGLSATNFSLKDNGVDQRFQIETSVSAKPLALVLLIQTGHDAARSLQQIAQLSDTLDTVLSQPGNQVAILTFDSRPHVMQEFTSDPGAIANALSSISKGNSRAALFDAVSLAIGYFRRVPADQQKVIFLISGEHDHGSVEYDIKSALRSAYSSHVSIFSFCFRSGGVQLFGKFHAINPLEFATGAMEKNVGATLAELTGGEFFRFKNEADLETAAQRATIHIQNRYILTFKPTNQEPGLHTIEVAVQSPGAKIAAAPEGYWLSQAATP